MRKGKIKTNELAYYRNKNEFLSIGLNLEKKKIQQKEYLYHADYYEILEGINFETEDFSKIKLRCYGIGRHSTKYTCE
jgi:CRISPR/Cas system CMR-associated protein Cmr3 (group 5 of RAMP superfamily)